MAKEMQEGPIHIHRSDVLDGLRALYLAQRRFDRFLKEDSYACGYREGFEDALQSIAQMVGVLDELEATQPHIKTYRPDSMPLINTDSS